MARARPTALALFVFAFGLPGNSSAQGVVPIEAPDMNMFGNAAHWRLSEPLVYRVLETPDSVIVPAGFVTDFASIPRSVQSFLSQLGEYVLPAVVHDYLYWNQSCTREQADQLFRIAMTEMEVGPITRWVIYKAVDLRGERAWEENAEARRQGLPRIVPDGVRDPGRLETWEEYREALRRSGIEASPGDPVSRAFCAHGG